MKNLLRFLNNNITRRSIDKRLSYLQGILFFVLLKIQIIFKWKSYTLFSWLFLFVDILFLFFAQSKSKWFSLRHFLIQTDKSFMYIFIISISKTYYLKRWLGKICVRTWLYNVATNFNIISHNTIIKKMESCLTFYSWRSVVFSYKWFLSSRR